ncbi:tryptophan synthase subunit alpha [Candidatus Micrarchaeota archaeon]|nr:tryptophan synthase subunit alpha [Candidatus Micrarchaeota archaeon]MBU1166296.1 tryptophan synthase subunit alpha [Candidatus Micrarchaeota archaeon]MBU1886394.1 tryptophan synthase subunit alpha [Candidatus Micrarchaeota archaeon]
MMFVPYVCCGDPNLEFSAKLIRALARHADIVELGIPFSDPIADGKTIQMATSRALANGVNIEKIFGMVAMLRHEGIEVPFVFMTYYNIVYAYGREKFLKMMKEVGVQGLIIPDLPFGEDPEFENMAENEGICIIGLITQNTKKERAKKILESCGSSMFTYLVSVSGVTGVRDDIDKESIEFVKRIRKLAGNKKKLCVGFGISNKKQAEEYHKAGADGIVIGSHIINIYSKYINGDKVDETRSLNEIETFCSICL